jgi:predicted pyridoxine 5'-phosphate oxidase superfamily flavin-nucleotide-binding protein
MARSFGSVAFTPEVKKLQEQHGSRRQYARMEEQGASQDGLTLMEMDFLKERDSFYWATTGSNGWPYLQHRGGPKGFLKVVDEKTLAFADFAGNKQYITTGNLQTDDRVAMIFVDYPRQARLKILGHARVLEGEEAVAWFATNKDAGYPARMERVFVIAIEAYDWNCPQHITPRYTEQEIERSMAPVRAKLEALEVENAKLREEAERLRKQAS